MIKREEDGVCLLLAYKWNRKKDTYEKDIWPVPINLHHSLFPLLVLSNRLILSVYNIDLLVHIINISYHHEI